MYKNGAGGSMKNINLSTHFVFMVCFWV